MPVEGQRSVNSHREVHEERLQTYANAHANEDSGCCLPGYALLVDENAENNDAVDAPERRVKEELYEEFVVGLADAAAEPRAKVIVSLNASADVACVVGSVALEGAAHTTTRRISSAWVEASVEGNLPTRQAILLADVDLYAFRIIVVVVLRAGLCCL